VLFVGKALEQRTLFWRFRDDQAVRKGPWKLVVLGDGQAPMLFNLDDDLKEAQDLAGQHPQRVEAMLAELAGWRAHVMDEDGQ
jgi:hypothetical protein